jgi:aryl-alcohol dehydrogenase-like predicted oxidoreductase
VITLPGTSLSVSPLAYGTGSWGSEVRGDELTRLYTTYRAAGGNAFDSAHCYAFWLDAEGASERALGECVRSHERRREDVVVMTKGGHPSAPPKYPKPDRYLSPEVLRKDIAESLDRLQTDYIDLYFLHRDDPRVPAGEIIDALAEHIAAGRIRYIGASNWRVARMAEANAYAASHGRPAFVASQVQWNLAEPTRPGHPGSDHAPRPGRRTRVARAHADSDLRLHAHRRRVLRHRRRARFRLRQRRQPRAAITCAAVGAPARPLHQSDRASVSDEPSVRWHSNLGHAQSRTPHRRPRRR